MGALVDAVRDGLATTPGIRQQDLDPFNTSMVSK